MSELLQTLEYKWKVLKTIKDEPFIVWNAAFGTGKAELTKYYWRFHLLWFLVDDFEDIAELQRKSPLFRNFCPLFWVTNLIILFSWIIFPIYYLYRMVVGLWACIKAAKKHISKTHKARQKAKKNQDTEAVLSNTDLSKLTDINWFAKAVRVISANRQEYEWASVAYYPCDDESYEWFDPAKTGHEDRPLEFFREFPEKHYNAWKKFRAGDLNDVFNYEYYELGKFGYFVTLVNLLRKVGVPAWLRLVKEHTERLEAEQANREAAAQKIRENLVISKKLKEDRIKAFNKAIAPMVNGVKNVTKWTVIVACIIGVLFVITKVVPWLLALVGTFVSWLWDINWWTTITDMWNAVVTGLWFVIAVAGTYGLGILAAVCLSWLTLKIGSIGFVNFFGRKVQQWIASDPTRKSYSCLCRGRAYRAPENLNWNSAPRDTIYSALELFFAPIEIFVMWAKDIIVPLCMLPIGFVKMFFSENCPGIEIKDEQTTDGDNK